MAGPMIDPTPKKPSTVFIIDVCSVDGPGDVADQGERSGLEDSDADSSDAQQNRKVHERVSRRK